MKYNYYDSNKIVIHGKAVPGQTLAWGETKMLTADKIQSVNTTDYWGNVLYENSGLQRYKFNGKELDLMHGLRLYDYGAECMTKYLAVGQVWTQWLRNIVISARMCSVLTFLYEWWIGMEKIHGIYL